MPDTETSFPQKINVANAWNFALIDYFHDMSLLRNNTDNSINFQRASCTLDGCVKIWTSRVDSVGTETGKLLSNLANEGRISADDDDEDISKDSVCIACSRTGFLTYGCTSSSNNLKQRNRLLKAKRRHPLNPKPRERTRCILYRSTCILCKLYRRRLVKHSVPTAERGRWGWLMRAPKASCFVNKFWEGYLFTATPMDDRVLC